MEFLTTGGKKNLGSNSRQKRAISVSYIQKRLMIIQVSKLVSTNLYSAKISEENQNAGDSID